ncbi:hypothetical protein [Streptomyces sp. Inha503]|uniref:hypothetical protein n=1 Tax=Streptomyces sp. Inha503 TaxID=3383314 RepID=UPI0039A2D8D0
MTRPATIAYDERLTAPRTWRLIAALFGLAVGLVFLPYGVVAALITLVAGACLAGVWATTMCSKARKHGPGAHTERTSVPSW